MSFPSSLGACPGGCSSCPSKCSAASSGVFTPAVGQPRIPEDTFLDNFRPTETRASGHTDERPASPVLRGIPFKTAGVLASVGTPSNGYGAVIALPGQRDSEERSGPVTAGASIGYASVPVGPFMPSYTIPGSAGSKIGNSQGAGEANKTDRFKMKPWMWIAGAAVIAVLVLR